MSNITFGNYTSTEKEDLMNDNEVVQPFKQHDFFYSSYVTNMQLHDGECAMTVVLLYDLKRYYNNSNFLKNEVIYSQLDIVALALMVMVHYVLVGTKNSFMSRYVHKIIKMEKV